MKKLIFCIIILILIFAGIYVAKNISKNDETVKTGTNTVKENTTNKIEEENKAIENEVEEQKNENETDEANNVAANNPEEQAKDIVKNNWGEDDSVYYSYDGIDKNGRYIICVRDKSTTKALFWYYVDLESGTFEIE